MPKCCYRRRLIARWLPAAAVSIAMIGSACTTMPDPDPDPDPDPVIWGGRFNEFTVTDTAVHLVSLCQKVRFEPLVLDSNQHFTLSGVVTHSTGGGVGLVTRRVGHISHDSVFMVGANLVGGQWGESSRPDTLLIGVPGDFSPDGGSGCII